MKGMRIEGGGGGGGGGGVRAKGNTPGYGPGKDYSFMQV